VESDHRDHFGVSAFPERLRITGVGPGRYDAKVGYRGSKHCFVRDIELKADAVFSIADKDLKDCNK
jgi:hypothetical protein